MSAPLIPLLDATTLAPTEQGTELVARMVEVVEPIVREALEDGYNHHHLIALTGTLTMAIMAIVMEDVE